ncbi:hypothetical protein J2Y45_006827 [Dyadobacter sp. BE34]|uniref:DUF3800 domain-containing protein n=1 Tax=Dyadobacter fermentans TaxID=94254 RepID=A0ABU1R9A6_9BACT|nr:MULTISPECIES: hypothetical protein [Dyadobacter]MDR6809792.1 hypothetical protein [Dyadobacter fermentans]MDR7047493.1 hypothetical protein [Dyadobacter sp. BE242]MDR7201663.1 hypothetical protein [Dyadobacter sp. BE34]MDR7219533.1 hypothetical protein [Dyadobacter sp. BE31]MDR7267344.1 hypothetical protein [Dyadobacter sp. BE32]
MQQTVAFLSEWGNDTLDLSKRGVEVPTTHFIITAIILNKEDIASAKRVIEAVRIRHFAGGNLDPELTANNHEKQKEILEDIDEAPFKVFAVIVDKRQLIGEGLRYKGSFHKFLHSLADRELFRLLPNLDLVSGPIGDNTFMKGFVKYVEQNHISNLFNESTFGFAGIENDGLVQAAGYIAGTLARCYDETVITDQRGEYIELLRRKLLSVQFFPDTFRTSIVQVPYSCENYNETLATLSTNLANDFLHRKSLSPVPQLKDQVSCLGYLLFHFRHINPTRYITSFELMEHIRARTGKKVSLHYFQTKVIAQLRDAGVLIASSSRGYKLPASEADLNDFVSHSNTIISPMLSRVKRFRDQVHTATSGEIDILAHQEYALIRKIVVDF